MNCTPVQSRRPVTLPGYIAQGVANPAPPIPPMPPPPTSFIWRIEFDVAYWTALITGAGYIPFFTGGFATLSSGTDPVGSYPDFNVTSTGPFSDNYNSIVVSGTPGSYSVNFTDTFGSGPTTEALVGSGGHYASVDGRVSLDLQP